ncbi:uncharacterized protein LOC122059122 [Macadamia integrifolia]|uniref:uncharacterized protein LOC122059122 n=1 Tax=Macadamia integrifolia TaxID=60698 RepID=UPI001C52F342|nr:uncharacterized protein LOC122059122 [Macadamia integrifolia]
MQLFLFFIFFFSIHLEVVGILMDPPEKVEKKKKKRKLFWLLKGFLYVGTTQGTEVVPSNSRSHTCLLSGVYIGNVKVLVRLSFGIDGPKQVAMKLAVRSEDQAVSDANWHFFKALEVSVLYVAEIAVLYESILLLFYLLIHIAVLYESHSN